mmetsp:Transcript_2114/g.8213  ORF Transcript_2114/g.8213 Transcript_2114/m.8213 type:complete len:305 (-) Transcript_2114:546-1460(-)
MGEVGRHHLEAVAAAGNRRRDGQARRVQRRAGGPGGAAGGGDLAEARRHEHDLEPNEDARAAVARRGRGGVQSGSKAGGLRAVAANGGVGHSEQSAPGHIEPHARLDLGRHAGVVGDAAAGDEIRSAAVERCNRRTDPASGNAVLQQPQEAHRGVNGALEPAGGARLCAVVGVAPPDLQRGAASNPVGALDRPHAPHHCARQRLRHHPSRSCLGRCGRGLGRRLARAGRAHAPLCGRDHGAVARGLGPLRGREPSRRFGSGARSADPLRARARRGSLVARPWAASRCIVVLVHAVAARAAVLVV